jgi:hypothetical protein
MHLRNNPLTNCWQSLTTNFKRQLRQKEEKLLYLCTYAFTINHVPHVFGDFYFACHKHKYSGKYTKRRFLTRCNTDMRKGIIKRPIYLDNLGEVPPKKWPMPSQRSTMRRWWPAMPARVWLHPRYCSHPSTTSRAHLRMVVQSMLLGSVTSRTSIEYAPQPTIPLVYIDMKSPLSQHTPFGATPQSLPCTFTF